MADVKWIKLTTDMFDNRKIKHLRRLPDGNNIVLIWVMLLTMAGRCNAGGMIFLTENIPYTPKMLADELDFEENTVLLALEALERFNMIVADNGVFTIAGWEEYQNIEGMDRIREQNRIRQKKFYDKQKALPNVRPNVSITQPNATEEEIEEELEIEEEREREKINYQQIADLFNSLCPSFPSIKSLSDARKKAIKARLNTYSLDDFRTLFEKAEASSFLKGANDRNWTASFDWLIKDANMAKVLDGNYDSRPVKKQGRKEVVPKWMQGSGQNYDFDELENDLIENNPKPVEDDPELMKRVERLKEQLRGC